MGMERGIPCPRGKGQGRGLCLLPRKFSDFGVKITCFGAFGTTVFLVT